MQSGRWGRGRRWGRGLNGRWGRVKAGNVKKKKSGKRQGSEHKCRGVGGAA